jgi:hypothetical protein
VGDRTRGLQKACRSNSVIVLPVNMSLRVKHKLNVIIRRKASCARQHPTIIAAQKLGAGLRRPCRGQACGGMAGEDGAQCPCAPRCQVKSS